MSEHKAETDDTIVARFLRKASRSPKRRPSTREAMLRIADRLDGPRTGVERIAAERQRQIDAEGYLPEHDAEHGNGALAWAAAVYAAPGRIFRAEARDGEVAWWEPWPRNWRRRSQPYSTYSTEVRLRDLEKAGALIAAEIDRIVARGGWTPDMNISPEQQAPR